LPAKNTAELADFPTLYVRCQGQGISFASSTNQLQLSLYMRLAPGFTLGKIPFKLLSINEYDLFVMRNLISFHFRAPRL